MGIVTGVNPNKFEELKRLQSEGRSISYAEVLAVHWPQPTGTRYYAISRFDLAPNFKNIPWKSVEFRINARQSEGVEAISYVITHDVNDDKISWEFIDHDLEMTRLYVLHQSAAKVELLCYVAEIDQVFNLWWGLLDPHGGRRSNTIKASATFGFRSPRAKIPRKYLSASFCQATFGDAETGCTYNRGTGGTVGNIDPTTNLPYTECPRTSRKVCFERIGGEEIRLPFQAFGAILGSETVGQSKGPNTLATSRGNDSALNTVLQLVFGKRKVRALPTRLFQIQTNTREPEKGTVSAIFPISDCRIKSGVNPKINNTPVTASGDPNRNQFFLNKGEIGQGPLPLTGQQQADNASGVAEFRGLVFGSFGGKGAGDFTGSIDVEGCDEITFWTGPFKGQKGYSTNRAECLRFLLENKRSGNGEGSGILIDSDWEELAARCNDQVWYRDADNNVATTTRSAFNAQIEARQASQVIRDVCLAGFFTAPFPFEGKKRIFLLKDEPLDASIPKFAHRGSDANVDWESVELIPTQGYEIVNAVTVFFEDAALDNVRRPLTFNYTELQRLRGQALGDPSEERLQGEFGLFGVTELGEAIRAGGMLGDLGPFAAGGVKNPLRVRFRSARAFLEPEFLTLHPYKLIDLDFPELAPYREPTGEPARYFRVLSIRRLENLQMEIEAQWWPYGHVKSLEQPPIAPAAVLSAEQTVEFSPTDISGLQLWLKADTLGLSDGATVATWTDSSGNGFNATQSTEANKPIYKVGIVGGKPVVRFDGTNDGMVVSASLSVALPCTVFVVYSYRSTTSAGRRAVQGVSNNWLIGPYSLIYRAYNSAFLDGAATTQNLFIVSCMRQLSGDAKLFNNGTQVATNANNTAPGQMALGASGAFGEPLDGDIAEVIVYNSALSTTDRQAVEAYLDNKYNLF